MPAGQSVVGIWNIAMAELGEDPLQSTEDDSKAAVLCATRWTDVRQASIRMHVWNCCKKYAQWALSPTAPPFGWANAFDLPADYIRHYGIMDCDGRSLDDADWEIVGSQLMTDAGAPLNVMYFFDLEDMTRTDALMAQVLGYELAIEIGPELCRDDQKLARIEQKRQQKLSIARTAGAQENSPREWDVDVLLRSRR